MTLTGRFAFSGDFTFAQCAALLRAQQTLCLARLLHPRLSRSVSSGGGALEQALPELPPELLERAVLALQLGCVLLGSHDDKALCLRFMDERCPVRPVPRRCCVM